MPILVALFLVGVLAGGLGAMLGIGGGVFVVPFLVLWLGLPIHTAIGVSLTAVVATSTAVSAGRAGHHLINLRLGIVLEVATSAGALAGGILALMASEKTLQTLFGAVTAAIAVVMLGRLRVRNVLPPNADPGPLGGRFYEAESGRDVIYRVRRLPVGLLASFAAGSLSSLLGVGGGIVKVPALNAWCGVPLRAAAATSAFMIGVTATVGAILYYARGDVVPDYAAAAVLGVLAGSQAGIRLAERAPAKWLKLLMAVVLFTVSALMFLRAMR